MKLFLIVIDSLAVRTRKEIEGLALSLIHISFMNIWNSYLWPLVALQTDDKIDVYKRQL